MLTRPRPHPRPHSTGCCSTLRRLLPIVEVIGLLSLTGIGCPCAENQQVSRPGRPAKRAGGRQSVEGRSLEAGKPVQLELAGGEQHYYRFTLLAGQFCHIVVDQRGIDVVVVLYGPRATRIRTVDGPTGAWGPEEFSVIAPTRGDYKLEVRPLEKDALAGRYEVSRCSAPYYWATLALQGEWK